MELNVHAAKIDVRALDAKRHFHAITLLLCESRILFDQITALRENYVGILCEESYVSICLIYLSYHAYGQMGKIMYSLSKKTTILHCISFLRIMSLERTLKF